MKIDEMLDCVIVAIIGGAPELQLSTSQCDDFVDLLVNQMENADR